MYLTLFEEDPGSAERKEEQIKFALVLLNSLRRQLGSNE